MSTLRCKKCVIKEPPSIPLANFPLPMPLSLLPIPHVRHRDVTASVVVPELSFEASHKVKTSYLLGC